MVFQLILAQSDKFQMMFSSWHDFTPDLHGTGTMKIDTDKWIFAPDYVSRSMNFGVISIASSLLACFWSVGIYTFVTTFALPCISTMKIVTGKQIFAPH